MALVLKDRVKETTTTTGTGAVTLDGASTGFQTFDAVGNFNQTYYTITDGTNWEAGIGTFGELESSAALSLAFDETTTLDSRITFTRATNGTYFDSAGVLQTASSNVARFDHRLEGGVWVNKGLLIEEQRANICLRSEDWSSATWIKTNTTVTANTTSAPNSATTADSVFETTTNGNHLVEEQLSVNITSAHTFSCFIKANGRTRGELNVIVPSGSFQGFSTRFNLTTETTSSNSGFNGGTVLDSSITNVGNGWYRVTLSGFTGVNGTHALRIFLYNDSGLASYAGDTSKGLILWGAQLEAGAFPTSYIATTTASVTRNADVATMTGTNFSDWYNATEGTVFWQGDMAGVSGGNLFTGWEISDNTATERLILINQNATGLTSTLIVRDNATDVAAIPSPNPRVTAVTNQTYKTASAYKLNDIAHTLDGVTPGTDTSATLPTVNMLRIGCGNTAGTSDSFLNGHIAKFYYWNTRLSNGTLQYLSSSFGSTSISRRLNRDTVLASSNSGNLVNFSAGTKTVFSPLPAIATQGSAATADDSSIGTDLVAWNNFKKLLNTSVIGGVAYGNNGTNGIVSTYSLLLTGTNAYLGAVLAPNGDVHFIPGGAARGQKISASGVVSTYALVFTITASAAYFGGVLAPNGDIHFVPFGASVGQKISASGVVSTYSLVYTVDIAYQGGVLAPNGDIHFVPRRANRGQKISAAGVVSTYSLVYTTTDAYLGGVLAPNGDIHFVPGLATVGQKISASGTVSTYSLVRTGTSLQYISGVIAPNGDIHFVPVNSPVGQKISAAGVVSTYSLVYTTAGAYAGGVLAPNGDIHFINSGAAVGQKVSASGVVSTYSLLYTATSAASAGGVLRPDGSIITSPNSAPVGQIIHTNPGIALGQEACLSSYLNKF